MPKPYSTKRPRPVPAEFEQNFIDGGWRRVNLMYGKKPAWRYFTALGGEVLSAKREQFKAEKRQGVTG